VLLRIAIELILSVAALLASYSFWQVRKRDVYFRHMMRDQHFLETWFSAYRTTFAKMRDPVIPFEGKNGIPYMLTLGVVGRADRAAIRLLYLSFGVPLAAILIGSYFLGLPYLAVNVALSCLSALAPLCRPAKESALTDILEVAVVLRKWDTENASDCEKFVQQAWALKPLYEAVRKAGPAVPASPP
jgi:hypothetical protein